MHISAHHRLLHLLVVVVLLPWLTAFPTRSAAGTANADAVTVRPRTAQSTAQLQALPKTEFSGSALPAGWTAVKVGTSRSWTVGTNGSITAGSGVVGAHARADNTAAGAKAMNTTLVLPALDLTAVVSPVLQYNSDFLAVSGSRGNIDVSTDGVNWTTLATLTANTRGLQQLAVPTAAGQSAVRLRFRYTAAANSATTAAAVRNKKRWRIDNIEILNLPVPAAAGDLSVSAAGAAIALSWIDDSDNEDGFRIQRSADSGASWSTLTTTVAGVTAYSDSSVDPARRYSYRVTAVNFSGSSSAVEQDFVPTQPQAPSNITLTAGQRHVVLGWTDNSSNERGFTIERRLGAGSWSTLTTTAAAVTAYTDTAVSPASDYSYRLAAVNDGPLASTTISADVTTAVLTAPAAPGALAATAGVTRTVLSWTDGGFTEDGFRVERTADGGINWTIVITTAENAVSYSDSGLTAAWPYRYRVQAVNSAGASSPVSVASETLAPLPSLSFNSGLPAGWQTRKNLRTSKPWRVVSGTASFASGVSGAHLLADNSAVGSRAMNTTLTLPSLNLTGVVSPVLRFNSDFQTVSGSSGSVELSLNGGSSWSKVFTATQAVSDAEIALPQAANAAAVQLRFTYIAAATTSTTPAAQRNKKRWRIDNLTVTNVPLPAAPTDLTVEAGENSVALNWTDVSLNETGYRVERSLNGSSWTVLTTTAADVTAYNDSGLSGSTTYQYRVSGVNRSGVGTAATVEVTTSAVVPPAAPGDFSGVPAATSVALSWTDNSNNEDGFVLQRSLDGSSWITVTTTAADVTDYTATGLSPETLYHFRLTAVRQGVASTAVTLQVTTDTAPPFSFSENFNVTPTGWTITGTTTAKWQFSTSAGGIKDGLDNMTGGSDGFTAINSDGYPQTAVNTMLTSPAIDMSSVAAARLSFKHHFKQYAQSKGAVEISSNGGSSWTRLALVTATITETKTIDISAYAGNSDVRVRFHYFDANWDYWWMIDDLSIAVITAPAQPTELAATLGEMSSVVLSWQGDGEAGSHIIERRAGSAASWEVLTSAAAGTTSYTDNSSSLLSNTAYDYRVTAVNSAGQSAASDPVSITTGARNVRIVDLTVSYWDSRANTAAKVTAIEDNIRYLADGIYEMSNGANRVGTVTISTDGARSGTSIQWIESCWPNAHVNGYGSEAYGYRIQHCDDFQSTDFLDWPLAGGYTIAHEMGHFFYGVYDEYKGSGACTNPGSPCVDDIGVPNSVMNSQWYAAYGDLNWLNFSTSRNNTAATNAQYRMYSASAWTTIARNPTADPVNRSRLYWPELAAAAPTGGITPTIDLAAPGGQAAARGNLNIVWSGGTPGSPSLSAFGDGDTVLQLLIDTSSNLNAQQFAALKAALRTVVDRAAVGDGLAISAVDGVVREILPLTIINGAADKAAVLAAIDGMQQTLTRQVQLGAGLQAAYRTLVSDGAVPETIQRGVVVITAGGDDDAAAALQQITAFSDARVTISLVGLREAIAGALLPLSEQTGGLWFSVNTDGLRQALEATLAVTRPELRARLVQQTLAGGTTLPFVVEAAAGQLEIGALVQAAAGTTARLQAVAPDGTVTRISCQALPGDGGRAAQSWCFTQLTAAAGSWQLRTAAGASYAVSVDAIGRRGELLLNAGISAPGGRQVQAPQPLQLELQVIGQYAVSGLAIAAQVTTPAGVTETVTFRDDGIAPDAIANDGRYTAIAGYSGNGSYRVRADVASTPFSAYSTLGVQFAVGPNGEERPQQLLPLGYRFQRVAETTVIVSGWQPDDDAAPELPLDGTVQYGRSEAAGDVDRFTLAVDGAAAVITLTDTAYGGLVELTALAADGQPLSAPLVRTATGAVLRLPAGLNGPLTLEVRGLEGAGFYALQAAPVE
jgi:hypothetical protein